MELGMSVCRRMARCITALATASPTCTPASSTCSNRVPTGGAPPGPYVRSKIRPATSSTNPRHAAGNACLAATRGSFAKVPPPPTPKLKPTIIPAPAALAKCVVRPRLAPAHVRLDKAVARRYSVGFVIVPECRSTRASKDLRTVRTSSACSRRIFGTRPRRPRSARSQRRGHAPNPSGLLRRSSVRT